MSEQMSEQTKMRYILAVFNPQTSGKWFILNRPFVIQPTKDKKISGVFLSDMWFNYLLGENTDDFIMRVSNDITFMIIKTNIHNNYVLDDLNRNHFNYHISSLICMINQYCHQIIVIILFLKRYDKFLNATYYKRKRSYGVKFKR